MRFFLFFFFLILQTIPAFSSSFRILDKEKIHGYYRNGDFDKVILGLNGFLKSGKKCSPNDSAFLEKHLAVVYAANPTTRELGRYHMHKMLSINPNADLIDMFVGEEVDGVFEKVLKEFSLSQAKVIDSTARKDPNPVPAPAQPRPPSNRTLIATEENNPTWNQASTWIGGGAAIALVAASLFYSSMQKESSDKTYVVPAIAAQ